MAAAIGPKDTLEQHIADTIAAGAGLCDPEAVRAILSDTQEVVAALERFGVSFTRHHDEAYHFHREAAHNRARILHAQGDGSGRAMMGALMAAAARSPDITFLHGLRLTDIATHDGHVAGCGWKTARISRHPNAFWRVVAQAGYSRSPPIHVAMMAGRLRWRCASAHG